MPVKVFRIGLFGLGTVGSGIVELLSRRKGRIGSAQFELKKVVVKNPAKKRDVVLPPGLISGEASDILANPDIDTVVEVIGGIHPAEEYILEALDAGKNVVTANKALLAISGQRIFQAAARNNRYLGVRASNIAAYRLIESLMSSPSRVEKLVGVFNGTSNFILTGMEETGQTIRELVMEAQSRGYAEMDPADDINGRDTAHKLVVLLGLALGFFPTLDQMHIEGIGSINPEDVQFAMDLGYRIKLLAIAQRTGEELEARVHPALVPEDSFLARLRGVENGMELRDEIGLEVGMQAPGAGKYPTATAIIEDFMCIAQQRRLVLPSDGSALHVRSMGAVEAQYYLKFLATDKAGVLASIANVFSSLGISIESVIQKGRQTRGEDLVPIIMLTHRSREDSIQRALEIIKELPVIRQSPFLVRVEEGVF